jgi:hypothetical protein
MAPVNPKMMARETLMTEKRYRFLG